MSNIVGLRVDERLIHGQVATAWTNKLNAERIMVIDDHIIKSTVDKMALKMACPSNCKLSILSTEKAVANLASGKYQKERIFIVCKRPKYFLTLLKNGISFTHLILGNMSKDDNARMLRRSVYVNEEQIKELNEISSLGVMITVQMTPADTGDKFVDLIK